MAEPIRRWIWQRGWRELHDIQERAIHAILDGDRDLIVAAATAGGKTEAAFLPLLSRLLSAERAGSGFDIVYVSPLKALINDQFRRLDDLCEMLEIPVHRWHGDVSAAAKTKARKRPQGILLITPESLEAMFVLRGLEVARLFRALDAVVVDELHALMDTERGIHLRSLLDRLELAARRRVRRIGLSATLGDMRLAAGYLRPSEPDRVEILASRSEGQELRVHLRGYRIGGGDAREGQVASEEVQEHAELAAHRAVADHLFRTLRGSKNLVFAGSREKVELYADMLREMSEAEKFPNEFHAHHANLSREQREFVEERLKRVEVPTSAVCTSTLELGIDIGEVESVAQVGAPFSVAAMRQRLGRSGRRVGRPAIMRIYVQERTITTDIHPLDELRLQLVQSVAMIGLLVRGWCEPPRPHALHLSTLVHQVLSVIAERGGARPRMLYTILCEKGPFKGVGPTLFAELLRALGADGIALIEQSPDGTLLLGAAGERLVEHYGFYAVFMTPEEYRIIAGSHTLGTLPITFPLMPDMAIVFSGRRWRVVEVCDREKVIEVVPDATGRPPKFGGEPMDIHDAVATEMLAIYRGNELPAYLDSTARELLAEGRDTFRRLGLDRSKLLNLGEEQTLLFPWRGTVATASLALALCWKGLRASPRHVAIEVSGGSTRVHEVLEELAASPPPPAVLLAGSIANLEREKYHPYLTRDLLIEDAAASRVDAEAVPEIAGALPQEAA